MKSKKRQSCPICASSQTFYHDRFWRCRDCLYQFADLQDKIFTKSYYQEDIGLLVQNVLEEREEDVKLRKYAFLAFKKINRLKRKMSVCDIGCGTGVFLMKLKKKGFSVYGYDINKAQTEFARKSNKLQNVTDSQSLKEYCRKKKIKKDFFDVITCFEVIEHILDLNQFMEEIHTYLKPGGILIFSTPNNDRLQIHEKWDYPPIHVSRFKRKNIEILLEKHNLDLQAFETFNELGYYSGNLIAKWRFSHNALEHMVKVSSDEQSASKSTRYTMLFRFLSQTKKTVCWFIDIPLYLLLSMPKNKGHTMFVIARKKI